jgi:hypothetical protein
VGAPKISGEEATAIALEAAENFTYQASTYDGTLTVSGFKIAPKSLGHAVLSYLNSKDQSSARGGDPFTLYPSWYVPLGFDKFYPGDVSGMTVSVWADTGEISTVGPVVVDSGGLAYSDAEEPIADEEEISQEFNKEQITMPSPIVISAVLGFVGVSLGCGKRLSKSTRGKVFCSRFGVILLSALIMSGILVVATPNVSADIPIGKSRIYASLYGNPDQIYDERIAAIDMCQEIAADFNYAGYSTSNLCGSGTTKDNVLSYASSDEQNYQRTAVFHFGHMSSPNWAYQDNVGEEITWSGIGDNTVLGKHFFVFLWVCEQARGPSYGIPASWMNRSDMSDNGYTNPDFDGQCYIGFYGFSPMISSYHQTFEEDDQPGPCKDFIESFYYHALHENIMVNYALDEASDDYFGCDYASSILNDGYNSWWPGGGNATLHLDEDGWFPSYWRETYPEMYGNFSDNRMRVFGDGTTKLYQPELYLSARDTNNDQVLPTFSIDGNSFSTQYVNLVPGAHVISVSDETGYVFDHFNYLGNNYYSRPLYTIVLDGALTAYYNIHVNAPSVSGPTTGDVDTSYQFSASTTDYYGHDVRYTFDWGDGSAQNVTGYLSSGATAYMNHSWSSGGLWDVKVKAQCYNSGVESSWSDTHTINIGNTLLWLSVDAYDDFYLDELYPDVYVDSNYVGTAPVSVQVTQGYHYIGVTNYVWNQNQQFGDYFDHFGPGSYSQNPSYMYISSDTELTAWYMQEGK